MESTKRRARLAGVVAATVTAVAVGLVAAAGSHHPRPVAVESRAVLPASTAVVGVRGGSSQPDSTPRRPSPRDAGGPQPAQPGPQPAGAARDDHSPPNRAPTIAAAGRRMPAGPPASSRPKSSEPPAATLVSGAGPIPPGWVTTAHDVSVGALTRVYLTIEPAHPSAGLPIVLLMHGRHMTPDGVLHISGLADRIGPAVLVVPAGWDRSWNSGDCCGAAYRAGVDDIAFIRAALAEVRAATPGGDGSKVYAVGFSNGGRLTYLLACEMPGVLSGFVAVEAVPVLPCSPAGPLDMTIIAQQSDPLLTVDPGGQPKRIDGFVEPTVDATLAVLQSVDRCLGLPTLSYAGVSVERTWTCADGSRLRYVWYPGGAHNWRAPTRTTPGATDFVVQMLGRRTA